MSRKTNQHIVPHPNGWAVKGAGASKPSSVHRTQVKAAETGRRIAQNQGTELLIHGENGQIRERSSFGNDPPSSKG
jgi:hypothetical protein